ncbi:MAG: hypothetical protein BWY63_03490 [Chloroflexi bacterium ADurb.Bin360]|nr:MAG: hypothetical protein BWY63_03490 [Chloroflexi bacterium ADurb.Bin360]
MSGQWQPWHTILVGLVLVVTGFVLPLLMVLGILKSTLPLNFIAYGASFAGLLLGIVGAALYAKRGRD